MCTTFVLHIDGALGARSSLPRMAEGMARSGVAVLIDKL